jgi:outer membrane protein
MRTAKASQPQLRQARAGTEAAQARADQAFAPLLPQVAGSARYQRSTANSASVFDTQSGQILQTQSPSKFKTYDNFNFGITANQLIYDFGQSTGRSNASDANVAVQAANERTAYLQVALNVRTSYFTARAAKALLAVARETLANQERHLSQVQGFVEVGTRSQIDLAQTRADRANARLQLINAENGYESAKAQLNQAMGIEGTTDYDVADESLAHIEGEDKNVDALIKEATHARPEFAALSHQVRSQEITISAIKGAYGPSLSVSTGLTEGGRELNNMAWNWNAGVLLSWPLYQGGQTRAQVQEARANLVNLRAQVDSLRQQIRLEIDQARLGVRAAVGALEAAEEVVVNAKERLGLAEGRYQTGVGNVIELGDAQLALTNAEAQKVQAEYNLASARAKLLQALGRP